MNDHTNAGRRPTTAPLPPAIPGLAWTQIRIAAVELATYGWPVLPGTYQLGADAEWLGKIGTIGLEPAADLWQLDKTTDPNVVMDWWTRRPYSILLVRGTRVEAVEAPAEHGQLALAHFPRTERGPVVATPFGSWLFFVRHDDEPARPDLIARIRAQVHTRGKWLPLPPTAREGMSYRWLVAPSSVGWTLPTSVGVQRALAASADDRAGNATPNGA
jgi:hypothetical protein